MLAQSKAIAKSYSCMSDSFFIFSTPGKKLNALGYSGIITSASLFNCSNANFIASALPMASPSGFSCTTIAMVFAFFISSKILSKVIFVPSYIDF